MPYSGARVMTMFWLKLVPWQAWAGLFAIGLMIGVYFIGMGAGKHQVEIERLKDDIRAERIARGLRDESQNISDYRLCLSLGGLSNDCERVFGLE